MAQLVVGLYDRLDEAQAAVRDLIDHGFPPNQISLVANDAQGKFQKLTGEQAQNASSDSIANGTAEGAGIGAVLGGLGGLLVGLGALAIPGIGPVLAAGPLVATLVGAGAGAVAGGIVGALVDAGVPQQQAQQYAEGVRRGGTLVSVRVPDDRAQEAANILNNHNPVDIDKRAKTWQQNQNWQGFNEKTQPMTQEQINQEQKLVIPEMSEDLRVGKREVETGGVRVNTFVTSQPEEETVNLREEHVNVERKPVDRPANPEDLNAFKEGTVEFTEHAEEAVADKQARVVDEVTINKDVTEHPETVKGETRSTHVEVEDLNANQANAGFNEFEPMFRNHFQTTYSGSNANYDQYRPMYQYGYQLGNQQQFRNQNWQQVEPVARQNWQQRNPNTPWDKVKAAVEQGYNSVKNNL